MVVELVQASNLPSCAPCSPSVVTIGAFVRVHLGRQAVTRQAMMDAAPHAPHGLMVPA